jgi:hypothetical protein
MEDAVFVVVFIFDLLCVMLQIDREIMIIITIIINVVCRCVFTVDVRRDEPRTEDAVFAFVFIFDFDL